MDSGRSGASIERLILRTIEVESDAAALLRRAARSARRPRRSVLALGKASVSMANEAIRVWGDSIEAGLVVTLEDPEPGVDWPRNFQTVRGSHPEPTLASARAGTRVSAFVERADPRTILTVLLSGGASAQVVSLRGGLLPKHAAAIFRRISRAGGTIEELNTVRRHIDSLKGGGLAERFDGSIESYILSDVVGDPLHTIGSGPTAPDPTTLDDALAVLRKRRLLTAVPETTRFLMRAVAEGGPETRKEAFGRRVRNTVIGNNAGVVRALSGALANAGIRVVASHSGLVGEAGPIGTVGARTALRLAAKGQAAAVIWGGEWTVTVGSRGGLGGPSQEAALAAAIELRGSEGARVLTYSTDGRDGPTPHAGAVVDGMTAARMEAVGVRPRIALACHDSSNALRAGGALISPGLTGTNLNHIVVAFAVPTLARS